MSGTLRTDLMEWMEREEKAADLVLAMGSSLCGMNADRMVETPSKRAARGRALGAVIVGFQRTQMDEGSKLRLFANIDETMLALALELALPVALQPYSCPPISILGRPHTYLVPYNTTDGKGMKASEQVLNLAVGSRLILTGGPGAGFKGVVRYVPDGKNRDSYSVEFPCTREGEGLGKKNNLYALGMWMIEAAVKGTLRQLPVTNLIETSPSANDDD